jgi:hypothetical protein
MLGFPKTKFFLFVVGAVICAGLLQLAQGPQTQRLDLSSTEGTPSLLPSSEGPVFEDQDAALIKMAGEVGEVVPEEPEGREDKPQGLKEIMQDFELPTFSWSEQSTKEIESCNCIDAEKMSKAPSGSQPNPLVPWGMKNAGAYLNLETAESCKAPRKYLETELAQLSPLLRQTQTDGFGEFPRLCMSYIQRQSFTGAEKAKSNLFARCAKKDGAPVKGNFKPCVTEAYVNSLYNSYTGLLACFGIPQRERLPKFMLESGSHITVLGGGWDTGFGQITGPAIYDANEHKHGIKEDVDLAPLQEEILSFEGLKKYIGTSDNKACKKFWPLVKGLKKLPFSRDSKGNVFAVNSKGANIGALGNRCSLLTLPANPLLQAYYFVIKDFQDRHNILQKIMHKEITLHPSKGRKKPQTMTIAQLFAQSGIELETLKGESFLQIMSMLSYNMGAGGATNMLINFLKMKQSNSVTVTEADFNFMSIDDPATAAIAKSVLAGRKGTTIKSRRATAIANIKAKKKIGHLTFPQYLILYQDVGGPGYLSWVANRAHHLNGIFKEGACIPEKFLSL